MIESNNLINLLGMPGLSRNALNLAPHSLLLKANMLADSMSRIRRLIHASPELAFEEYETSTLLARCLAGLGYMLRGGIADTGIIADIGNEQGKTIALKTELDASPIDELNQVMYRSRKSNVMHACGHDAHLASALGTAEIIANASPRGRFRLILQPAEEGADANGLKGSAHMLNNGAMSDVGALIGFHVDATIPFGKIAILQTALLKLETSFEIKLRFNPKDQMQVVSNLLSQLLELRQQSIWLGANLQINNMLAPEQSENITLSGRFLAAEENLEACIKSLNKLCIRNIPGPFKLTHKNNHALIKEHESLIELAALSAYEIVGPGNTMFVTRKSWTREFAKYAVYAPSAFLLFGTQIPGMRSIQNSSTFDLDEKVMPIAAATISNIVSRYLAEGY